MRQTCWQGQGLCAGRRRRCWRCLTLCVFSVLSNQEVCYLCYLLSSSNSHLKGKKIKKESEVWLGWESWSYFRLGSSYLRTWNFPESYWFHYSKNYIHQGLKQLLKGKEEDEGTQEQPGWDDRYNYSSLFWSLFFYFGAIPGCSGLIPASVFRDHSWWGTGNHMCTEVQTWVGCVWGHYLNIFLAPLQSY